MLVSVSPRVWVKAFAVSATKAFALAKVKVPAVDIHWCDQAGRNSPPIFKEWRPLRMVSVSANVAVVGARPEYVDGPPNTRLMPCMVINGSARGLLIPLLMPKSAVLRSATGAIGK